jgi:hypothetical protein
MIVYANLQLYNENEPSGEPFCKEFESLEKMREWLRNQMGHPFLSYRLLDYESYGEDESNYVDFGDCSYRGIDGGPGPFMCCDHPKQTHGHYGLGVISWNDARTRRIAKREECPLVNEE